MGSAYGMVLAVGVSSVECVAGVGWMCTGLGEGADRNGLLVAWAVALGFNFIGNGLRISFWGSDGPKVSVKNLGGKLKPVCASIQVELR